MQLFEFDGDEPSKEELEKLRDEVLSTPYSQLEKAESIVWFEPKNTILVDDWVAEPDDLIFKHVDKAIILPVSAYYGLETVTDLDFFVLSPKRCYNREEMRTHTSHYLNYFEKFYDTEHELVAILFHLKYILDYTKGYTKSQFFRDLKRYILNNKSLFAKIYLMNEDNYLVELKSKKGKYVANLQYSSRHAKILMEMSLLMNMVIPLVTHFAHIKSIDNIDGLLLEVFDIILELSHINMYSKLYETATSEVDRNKSIHTALWAMQDIRGKDTISHSMECINNIILNIMPKYAYNSNIIAFNSTSIRKNTGYKITDIKYEFNFTLLSSSQRDEDFNSDFDKFESYLIRQDESLYLQNKCNCQKTMETIEGLFGPFDEKEIEFYMSNLRTEGGNVVNMYQQQFIFNIFYKYFGDPQSIKAINSTDYIKLLISARKILEAYNMIILPYIVSGKVVRIPNKKSINKKELIKITSSKLWALIQDKYKNPKIEEDILGNIGILLSSEFKIIAYDCPELHGKTIECISDIVSEEYLMYVLMI